MTLPTCCEYYASQLPDGCKCGRLCPERTSLLSPQERRIFACIDRWGAPVATALVVLAVIALFVVANWQRLQMLFAA